MEKYIVSFSDFHPTNEIHISFSPRSIFSPDMMTNQYWYKNLVGSFLLNMSIGLCAETKDIVTFQVTIFCAKVGHGIIYMFYAFIENECS